MGSNDAGAEMRADASDTDYAYGDADTDADTDTDSDADTDGIPEQEEETDYRVPQSSGRYVFVADAAHNTVAVVDSETLEVRSVEVGARPTHIVPLADDDAVAVFNLDSANVTLIRIIDGAALTVTLDVRPGTNALRATDDGQYVVAFFDPLFAGESGVPGTDQEISVIDTTADAETVFHTTVGMHPSDVVFDEAGTGAFVITEEGVSAVDLAGGATAGLPPIYELFDTMTVDPDTVETTIVPDGSVAIGREDATNQVVFAYLDPSEELRTYNLSATPTDVDVAPDGSWGMFVIRSLGQVAFFDLPLPADPAANPFNYVSLNGAVCGLASITPDGAGALLYTTTGGDDDDKRTLTLMEEDLGSWAVSSTMTERAIATVIPGRDSQTGIVLHDEITPGSGELAHSYTMLTLPGMQKKFQQIPVEPTQILLTPDGGYGFMLLGSAHQAIRRTEVIDLTSFIVDDVQLGSQPTAAGFAPTTNRVFVAQDHAAGRMTFIGVDDDSVKTVTGYTLNNDITD